MYGWEKALIGSVIYDPQAMAAAEGILPGDFAYPPHRLIWAEILALHRRGSLDVRAVIEMLRASLDQIASPDGNLSGEAYFGELVQSRGSAVEEYAERVLSASIKRSLKSVAGLIRAEAEDERVEAEEVLDNAERRLLSLRRTGKLEEGMTIGDIIAIFMPRFEGLRDGTYQPAWVPHLQALKDLIDYAEDEDYIINAGRPGDGKSSVTRFESYWLGKQGVPNLIFNMDNSHIDYARNLLGLHLGIDTRLIKMPKKLADEQVARIKDGLQELVRMPIHIVTLGSPDIDEIDRILRKKIAQNGVRWVGIDYIQQINNGLENKVQDVSKTSAGIKRMGVRYHVPFFANSQLSRAIERSGDDAEPQLADLRDSGSLEQDATMIMFVRPALNASQSILKQFPENAGQRDPVAIPLKIYLKKHRNGKTGVSSLIKWVKSTGNLQTLTNLNGDN